VVEPSQDNKLSALDLNQRYPFLVFYISAAVFCALLIFAGRGPTPPPVAVRVLGYAVGGFALWSFYRLFRLTDERQRQTNERALLFGFFATLAVSLVGGFARGFSNPVISCGELLALMLIAWSVGLLVFSWRYR
jgi:hypothetical protein